MVENINGLSGQQFSYEQFLDACVLNRSQGINTYPPRNRTIIFFITPTKKEIN